MLIYEQLIDLVQDHADPEEIIQELWRIYKGSRYPPLQFFEVQLVCCAVEHEHTKLVTKLLKDGFPVNYPKGFSGPLPLHAACDVGNMSLTRQLLHHGADVNVSAGASVSRQPNHMWTALEFVASHDNMELMQLLLPHYQPAENRQKQTALHVVCRFGAIRCFKYLIAGRLVDDINVADAMGTTALMMAVPRSAQLVEMLIHNGADVNVKSKNNETCLHHATMKHSYPKPFFVNRDLPQVLSMLVTNGLDSDVSSVGGDTGLSLLMTQISCELYSDETLYPYSLEEHRDLVVQCTHILLNSPSGVTLGGPTVSTSGGAGEAARWADIGTTHCTATDCTQQHTGTVHHHAGAESAIGVIFEQLISVTQAMSWSRVSQSCDILTLSAVRAFGLAKTLVHILLSHNANICTLQLPHPPHTNPSARTPIDATLEMLLFLRTVHADNVYLVKQGLENIGKILLMYGSPMCGLPALVTLAMSDYQNHSDFITDVVSMMSAQEWSNFQSLVRDQCAGEETGIGIQILEGVTSPRSLKDLCKYQIYESCGRKMAMHINALKLPRSINEYLTLYCVEV